MARPDDPHSIFHEPHLWGENSPGSTGGSPAQPDSPSDEPPVKPPEYRPGEGIYDEPDILPGRPQEIIEQDWSCSNCGYNLRGLPVGHLCPECGRCELYRPAPPEAPSYQSWMLERLAQTSPTTSWIVAVLVALSGGVWALLVAMFGAGPVSPLTGTLVIVAFWAPLVEETMKIATAAYVVERRPYLLRRSGQLYLATLGCAAVFAAIENVLYLRFVVPVAYPQLVAWRWTVCVAMHLTCTLIATAGLIGPWKRAVRERRPPKVWSNLSMLIAAMVVHGAYNAVVFFYEPV